MEDRQWRKSTFLCRAYRQGKYSLFLPTEEEIRLALTRQGKPTWTEEAFQRRMRELQGAGYGWLRPEGVKVRLLRMGRRR